jgi:acetyl esterase/lipase
MPLRITGCRFASKEQSMRLLPAGLVAFGILPILALAAFAQQEDQGFSVVAGGAPRALATAQAAPMVRNTLSEPPAPTPRPATPPLRRIAPPDLYGPQVIGFPDNVAGAFNVTYSTLAGFRPLTLDLYTPRPSDMPRPLVVFVHGGSWNSGDSRHAGTFENFPHELAALAANGYVVASVNYRLSQEARFPAALQDVKAAIRWLRTHAGDFNIDITRVAVWGASSGGQLAALAGTTCGVERFEPAGDAGKDLASDCVQAVIDWYGVSDLEAMTDKPGPNGFAAGSTSATGNYLGCEPAACAPGVARLSSPVAFVSARSPAFLIQHGAADTDVPPSQSRKLYDALRAAGVPAEITIYPEVGHKFARDGEADATVNAAAMGAIRTFLAATFPNVRIAGHPQIRRAPLD